jgi:hypothetical protein
MNRLDIGRIAGVLIGGAVLFGLELGFDMKFYIAIPLAIIVYAGIRIGFGLIWGASDKTN